MWFLAFRQLFRNPRRTLACLAAIVLGLTGLMIFEGFQESLTRTYREKSIRIRTGHGLVFRPGFYEKVHETPSDFWLSNAKEIEAKLRSIPEIEEVFPRLHFSVMAQGKTLLSNAIVDAGDFSRERNYFTELNIIQGRFLGASSEILLGKGLAEKLNVKVGDQVLIMTPTLKGPMNALTPTVVGIFHAGKKEFDDVAARIPLEDAQSLLDTDRIEGFSLWLKPGIVWPQVKSRLQDLGLEPFSFEELDKTWYQNSINFLNAEMRVIRLILLLIVGLGVFNTISTSFLERAGEIGALRANGESRQRLFLQMLAESVILGALGIAISVLCTFVFLWFNRDGVLFPPGPGLTRSIRIPLVFPPMIFVRSGLIAWAVVVLSAIPPILRLIGRPVRDLLLRPTA